MAPDNTAGYYAGNDLSANWKLKVTSICIDAGDDYLADDIIGIARPQGDYSDIGAYEYSTETGFSTIFNVKSTFYTSGNQLVFNNLDGLNELNIYTITGALLKKVALNVGINNVALQPNRIYLIKTQNLGAKVIL
ncbi:MAG: choice-of-anchor Q domain-containing protein [Paludibacteraceae bacterium]